MISLLSAISFLLLGWMTEEMLYQQQQQSERAELPPAIAPGEKPPPPPPEPSEPPNRRAGLANEPGTTERTTTIKTNTANQQGIYWLGLLDQGQYGPSYLAAGSLLKDVLSQDQWMAAMKGTRAPLGSAKARKLMSTKTMQSLPGGTRGSFTQLTYQTQFSGGNRIEILTLISDAPRGDWKVVSYQTKK